MALKKCKECGHEISAKAGECMNCGSPQKPPFSIFRLLSSTIKWGVALLFGYLIYTFYGTYQTVSEVNSDVRAEEAAEKIKVLSNIDLIFDWDTAGFDNIMEATFVIKNNSERNVKDITIECFHTAKSGTVIDKNERTIYESFPAKSEKSIENMSMGFIHSQVEKSGCIITDAVIL